MSSFLMTGFDVVRISIVGSGVGNVSTASLGVARISISGASVNLSI